MTSEALANAIRARFRDQVEIPHAVVVQYDNAPPITKPDGPWVRFNIVEGETAQVELGAGKRFRTVGIAYALILSPVETGDLPARNLADKIVTPFRAITVGDITYRTPTPKSVGRAGKWWQFIVEIPFYSDEVT